MSRPIEKRLGSTLGILGEFRNSAAVLTNPTTVTAGYIRPDGSTGTLTAAQPTASPWNQTGYYSAQVDSDQVGHWILWMKGDDTFDEVQQLEFTVVPVG